MEMKTTLKIIAALALAIPVCCTKTPELEPMVMTTVKISATRPSVAGAATLSWPKKDSLGVYDGAVLRKFTCPVAGSTTTFTGQTSPADPYYVVYPYIKGVNYKDGKMKGLDIPSSQIAVKGSFGPLSNPCVARTVSKETSVSANLKYSGAFVSFTFSSKSVVKTITLSAAGGENVAGGMSVSFEDSGAIAAQASGVASKTVVLTTDTEITGGKYFIATLPGKYSKGLSLTFSFKDGASKSVSTLTDGAELKSGAVVDFGTIDIDNAFSDDPDDPSEDKVLSIRCYSTDYQLDLKKVREADHPRLFMTANDFKTLNERLARKDPSDLVYVFHNIILKYADVEAARTAPEKLDVYDGKRALTQARNSLQTLFFCAYAYKTTGEKKYFDTCVSFLNGISSFKSWNAENHFLDPSEFALGFAVAYDWLYYDLDYETRKKVRNAMIEFDMKPYLGYLSKIPTYDNWNQVCNGGALAAAIVTYEKDKNTAGAIFKEAVESNRTAVKTMYDPTGNGIEGYGYWDYAMMFQVVILQSLETVFGHCCGLDKSEGLRNTARWMLYMDGPSGPFNFSDSAQESSSAKAPMLWLAAKYDNPGAMVREKMLINAGSFTYSPNRCLPLYSVIALMKHPFSDPAATDLGNRIFPSEKIWSPSKPDESPLVLVRLGWNYDGTDRYVGYKGGGAYNNHSHMDAGSFVYQSQGVRWTTDIPMGGYSPYEAILKDIAGGSLFGRTQNAGGWNIFCRSNYFHNTLSFTKNNGSVNGKINPTDQVTLVQPTSNNIVPTLYDSESSGYGGMFDLSPYYPDAASSVKRTVKIVGEELHVIDEIKALSSMDAEFQWRIVTRAAVSVDSGYITLSLGGKTMYLKTSVTSGSAKTAPVYGKEDEIVRPSFWSAEPGGGWDACQSYSGFHVAKFSSSVAKGSSATYTTIFTPEKP